MRFHEIVTEGYSESNPSDTLVTLLNYILNKADEKSVSLPTAKVLALMNNAGIPSTYDDLDNMVKGSDTVKGMIKSLDPKTAVISKSSQPDDSLPQPGTEKDVASMAARASKKRID